MEASRAFGTPAAGGGAWGVAGVSWLGVAAAAGRGEGDPKLEMDWWLKGLWYREGSSRKACAPVKELCSIAVRSQ